MADLLYCAVIYGRSAILRCDLWQICYLVCYTAIWSMADLLYCNAIYSRSSILRCDLWQICYITLWSIADLLYCAMIYGRSAILLCDLLQIFHTALWSMADLLYCAVIYGWFAAINGKSVAIGSWSGRSVTIYSGFIMIYVADLLRSMYFLLLSAMQ